MLVFIDYPVEQRRHQIRRKLHVLYGLYCPILIPFWQGIQVEIQNILKIKLPLNPLHYILGLTPGGDIGKRLDHFPSHK